MYKYIEPPCINLKKNFFINKMSEPQCEQMEQDIFNFINLIRQKPSKLIQYIKNSQIKTNTDQYEINQLINYIHNLSINKISFPPLLQKKELTKISNDLLNYIKNKINTQEKIKNDLLQNPEINLRIRSSPYITIKGKYYEGIVLESNDLIEIISYILKDIKGRNVLFNKKIKYISIACGYIENRKEIYNNKIPCKICTIIDLVQDFEKNYEYYNNNNKTKILRNKYILPKSYSYDKIKKRKTKQKKYNNNLIKDNTYDNILFSKFNNNSPLSKIKEEISYENNKIQSKAKTPIIPSLVSKIKSQKLFNIINTPNNTDLNKIYNNNYFYCSKYEKKQEEKSKEKKELDNISESKDISSVSFSKKKSKKKLNPEEKLELLRQINKESREKSKKKKSVIKIDDDSKSASFTTKKNDISNDASFSEIISVDNEKKPKINIDKLKNELKKELKNEVKEEIKAELENKIDINNKLKIPLLKLFLNQNVNDIGINNTSDYSYDIGINNKIKRNTKGLENYNSTNRSINSIDIFLPPNKNITAFDNDAIPGLININSEIINKNDNNNINNKKKENVIIKKFVKLNRIKNKGNKTPNNTINRNYKLIHNISPNNRKTNFIYHKIPFANNNIYCNNIKKKNNGFNSKNNFNNFNNINSPNILNCFARSPRNSNYNSPLTFKKIIVKNNNNNNKNNSSKGQKTTIDKIIKIPKKIINNLNYIDNNSIIINNKTNNIVYIKQTSPNRIKRYEINNISKKK